MAARKAYDKPSEVVAEKGHVLVDGPYGVSVTMTSEAAAETSDRLIDASAQAQGQRLIERQRKRRDLKHSRTRQPAA